ncbi:MAG TPA: hypothetical protein PK788_10685 [Gemmatimonadaceae bacterium]|nr:hypothetical protein [Gemmatimonadaceae bacterium]HRQ77559.1 hypothetical protein [Gemmatimonadaceae bacterium]
MNEDIVAIGGFFFTVIVLVLGVPIVRAWAARKREEPHPRMLATDVRLERMERAIESMAIEIERISEGQRFVTRLLAERDQTAKSLPRNESH